MHGAQPKEAQEDRHAKLTTAQIQALRNGEVDIMQPGNVNKDTLDQVQQIENVNVQKGDQLAWAMLSAWDSPREAVEFAGAAARAPAPGRGQPWRSSVSSVSEAASLPASSSAAAMSSRVRNRNLLAIPRGCSSCSWPKCGSDSPITACARC